MPLLVGMSARTTSAAADTIVLAVTLKKTFHSFAHAKRMHFKLPLITTLIRDGEEPLFRLSIHGVTMSTQAPCTFCKSGKRSIFQAPGSTCDRIALVMNVAQMILYPILVCFNARLPLGSSHRRRSTSSTSRHSSPCKYMRYGTAAAI